jgi:hypothetical protein
MAILFSLQYFMNFRLLPVKKSKNFNSHFQTYANEMTFSYNITIIEIKYRTDG